MLNAGAYLHRKRFAFLSGMQLAKLLGATQWQQRNQDRARSDVEHGGVGAESGIEKMSVGGRTIGFCKLATWKAPG